MDQKYHVNYNALLSTMTDGVPTHFRAQNDFRGIGAHLGTELQWYCTKSCALIGRASGSLLYADFRLRETLTLITDNSGSTELATVRDHQTTGATNLEAMLGFQWETFFCQNKYRLSLSAGYEWNLWFAQNRMIAANNIPNSSSFVTTSTIFDQQKGNLTLQGATFQARFDF